MRYAYLLVVLLHATPVTADVPALCADAPNQTAATLCAKRRLQTAEEALAKALDALKAKLDPTGRRNLDRAQQAWRRFSELECHLETGFDVEHPDRSGTIMPMLLGECATRLAERRARDLSDQLACPGGDLSCKP